MKVMVIGGAGFIGSNIVDLYVEAGHDVVVVDNFSSGQHTNVHPSARQYNVDIRSADLERVFELEQPEVVNHQAAQKSVPMSVEDPVLDADINIIGLLRVLQLCVRYHVRKVIFSSSGGALAGDADQIPTSESYEPVMISPYAIAKYASEKYLYYYSVIHGLKYTVLRYANVYGPRQIADGECGVVPIFLNHLLRDQPSTLFAYADMPKGTTRDYVYVGDVARANLLALTQGDNLVLNIGSGEEMYIEDIYSVIEDIVDKHIPLIHASERVGDVRRSALDGTRARQALGWTPQVSFDEGLRSTLAWISAHQ